MSAPGLSALPPATVHKRQIPKWLRKAAVFEQLPAPRGRARDSGATVRVPAGGLNVAVGKRANPDASPGRRDWQSLIRFTTSDPESFDPSARGSTICRCAFGNL